MSKLVRVALSSIVMVFGLYVISYHVGTNLFYVGLLATIAGGWWLVAGRSVKF